MKSPFNKYSESLFIHLNNLIIQQSFLQSVYWFLFWLFQSSPFSASMLFMAIFWWMLSSAKHFSIDEIGFNVIIKSAPFLPLYHNRIMNKIIFLKFRINFLHNKQFWTIIFFLLINGRACLYRYLYHCKRKYAIYRACSAVI